MNNLIEIIKSQIQHLEITDEDFSLLRKITGGARLVYEYGILHPDDQNGVPELMVIPARNDWLKYLGQGKLFIINGNIIINCRKVMNIILCKEVAKRGIQINVELSGVCNLQCHYCSLDRKLGNRSQNCFMVLHTLDLVFQKVINNQIYNVNGGICFWNDGEPLLHPKFDEITEYLSNKQKVNERGYNFVLMTNAMCLTDEKSKMIIDSDAFKEIIFSIDGWNVESLEIMHYPAKWGNVSSKIHAFLDYREKVQVKLKPASIWFLILILINTYRMRNF